METFLFAANAVLPIVLLVVFGYVLKRIGLVDDRFLTTGNRFAFRALLSVLLFYNTYNIEALDWSDLAFMLYAVAATLVLMGVGLLVTLRYRSDPAARGALVQGVFRSNYAIIGIPLATALYGDAGAAAASLLSAVSIPLYNALAVITLTVFDPENKGKKVSFGKIVKGIFTNPLILGVLAGLVCQAVRAGLTAAGISWRLKDLTFLWTAVKNVAQTASPFMLIVLGGRFEFSAVREKWKPITLGVIMRLIAAPVLTLVPAYFLLPQLGGQHVAAYLALFGTPVAVSSAVMAREMHSDDVLAGQLVVWTTVLSMFTLFGEIILARTLGWL